MTLGAFYDNMAEAARQNGVAVDKVLDELRGAGYEAVNVNLDSISDTAAFRNTMSAHGMYVGDAFDRVELISTPRDRGDADRRFERACELGARRFLFIPCQYGDAAKNDIDKAICEGLAWASERAASFGLEPVIEAFDVGYTPLCSEEVISAALSAAPKLRLAVDTGNYIHGGYDALECLRASRERLAGGAHLKDRTKKARRGETHRCLNGDIWYACAAGDGEMRIAEIMKALRENGFDGVLYAEQYGDAEQLNDLLRAADFIKSEWDA